MKPWELGDDSVFREPSREKIKEHRQKEFNLKQRFITKAIGENMASIGAILIVLFFVGYIWTDIQIRLSFETILLDGAVTVAFLVFLESMCTHNGIKGGKLDDVYIQTHNEYLELRKKVTELGISMMSAFCENQIDVEYETYMRRRCKELKISYEDYLNEYSKCSYKRLKSIFPRGKAARIFAMRSIKSIELTPDMLMTDGSESVKKRGGLGKSAADYIREQNYGFFNLLMTVISGFCSAAIAFYANDGASWGLVMYTIMKLVLGARKAYSGYSKGAKAYNTYEVIHMQDKMMYLNLYREYVEEYSKKGEDYGTEGNKSEQTDPQGRREGEGGGVLHDRPAESVRASASG